MERIRWLINQRRQQFLIHSFLYYRINEPIISDSEYDRICDELNTLRVEHAELAAGLPYSEICEGIGGAGSGYFIKKYPQQIISKAFHLLAKDNAEPIEILVTRFGYKLEGVIE